MAPQHPEWKTTPPFQAVLDGDMRAVGESGTRGLAEIVVATTTGLSTDEYARVVSEWLRTA